MRIRLVAGVASVMCLMGVAVPAAADPPPGSAPSGTEVSFLIAGLLSYQPAGETGASPSSYRPAFGGLGPGFAAGLQVCGAKGWVVTGELSVETRQMMQYGYRLNPPPDEYSTRATQVQLAFLAGQRFSVGRGSMQWLGGVGLTGVLITMNGVARDFSGGVPDDAGPVALVLGVGAAQRLSASTDLVETARFSAAPRSAAADAIGLGRVTWRFGVGVRIHSSDR